MYRFWILCSLFFLPLLPSNVIADHRDEGLSTQVRRPARIIINREERERQTGTAEGVGEEFLYGTQQPAGLDRRTNIIQAPRITLFNGSVQRFLMRLN